LQPPEGVSADKKVFYIRAYSVLSCMLINLRLTLQITPPPRDTNVLSLST